jgi:hypothetical protein
MDDEDEAEGLTGSTGTRSRSCRNLAMSLFRGDGHSKIFPIGQGHHAQAASKIEAAAPLPMPENSRGSPPGDTAPKPKAHKKTAENTIQGGRPPLSQSLRPAEPPEEGERGAGRSPATLKANERWGKEIGRPSLPVFGHSFPSFP